jgi:hypothetical protein
MSAYGTLDLLFTELRESIIAYDEPTTILTRYQNVLDEFPTLTLGDVVYEFRLWLKARQDEELENAENYVAQHYGIRVIK